jgi:hypothetical protein
MHENGSHIRKAIPLKFGQYPYIPRSTIKTTLSIKQYAAVIRVALSDIQPIVPPSLEMTFLFVQFSDS